jgi:hypothetical protein
VQSGYSSEQLATRSGLSDCTSNMVDCSGECDGDTMEDCYGECGGDAVEDECGECGGDGSSCGESHYVVDLAGTGESQLTIFTGNITGLEVGDEVGIFDENAITNYNDCSNQIGELLVGAGVWSGEQLNLVSIGSNDLCAFGGVQLAGYVEGNPVIVRVYKPSTGLEYGSELTWGHGNGEFGDVLQSIDEIVLTDLNACADDDEAVAGFGDCAGIIALLGCDFVFAGAPVSDWCPVSCVASAL